MKDKNELYADGCALILAFCTLNNIPPPEIIRLPPTDRRYHLATCAYYRPHTIRIMVEKCAKYGFGGRAWSWPGYVVDRTPYGVMQHENAHHVDNHFFKPGDATTADGLDGLFSKRIYDASGEKPLTGYLGTDTDKATFYMEWFAENFRLFVTNPHLSSLLRPRFFRAMRESGINPVMAHASGFARWDEVLRGFEAPDRIIDMAKKKIADA